MPSALDVALSRWHRLLGLQRHAAPWYRARLREELRERHAARTLITRLSETSDVFYTLSRARHDGHPIRGLPAFRPRHGVVYAYLMAKYTSRWSFYRVAARAARARHWREVREVVNPAREGKVGEVAGRHGIDVDRFEDVCRGLRRWWPLFP